GVSMMRFARVVSCLALFVCALAAPGRAQSASADSRYYAEFNGGATFGHKSSGSVGAQGGYHVTGPYTVFVEGGRMFNVGTSDLDARAQVIANEVGATASASYKANYFDGGLRYVLPPNMKLSMLNPYLVVGVGFASVRAETALAVNGNTVPPETLGV